MNSGCMNRIGFMIILIGLLTHRQSFACSNALDIGLPDEINQSTASTELNRRLLDPSTMSAIERPPLAKTLESIFCYLNIQSTSIPALTSVSQELQNIAQNIIEAPDEEAKGQAIIDLNNVVNRDAGTAYVEFPTVENKSYAIDLYADLIEPNCSNELSSDCAQSLNLAAHLWWIAGYARAIPDHFNDANIIDSLAFNDRLNKKWLSYKDDTILLWPQEVLLNSLAFRQEDKGFTEPPAYKLLALRPSLGLSYLSDEDHRIQPTLNVDLLGIYWWKYGGEKGVKAQPGKGVSLSMIWDGNDTAYGLSYHHNPRWSATIASGDDNDVVVSISFQLAAWLLR